jgi:hypothetical protein
MRGHFLQVFISSMNGEYDHFAEVVDAQELDSQIKGAGKQRA